MIHHVSFYLSDLHLHLTVVFVSHLSHFLDFSHLSHGAE